MPPRITKVKWSALELPFGVRFDEDTGVFNGIPEDGGEYVVPVTVQTNYGKDTKDVLLNVIETYKVYAIGEKAETWSEGAEPDENGFMALNMPKMKCLVPNAEGFGANAFDGSYYCCGIYDIKTSSKNQLIGQMSNVWITTDTPIAVMYDKYTVERTLIGVWFENTSSKASDNNGNTYTKVTDREIGYIIRKVKGWNGSPGIGVGSSIYVSASPTHTVVSSLASTAGSISNTWADSGASHLYTSMNLSRHGGSSNFDTSQDHIIFGENSRAGTIPYILSDFGETLTTIPIIATNPPQKALDKKAIKLFNRQVHSVRFNTVGMLSTELTAFQYLTEDKLLNNNAENFTEGNIKDAWVNGKRAYIATDTNELYEYDYSSKNWSLEGSYNVKKIVMNDISNMYSAVNISDNVIFLLTNDGALFHKGTAVEGVTDEHNNFTMIFPTCRFKDIEFGGNTLVVLRED